MAHAVLDVVAKNPKEEHVAGDVRDAAMHEHRNDQGEINGTRRGLQTRKQELLTGVPGVPARDRES